MSTSRTPARIDDVPDDYAATLQRLATEVRSANVRATCKVNTELIGLYWSIGQIILERQAQQGWGTKVIAQYTFGNLPPEIQDALPSPADLASFAAEAVQGAGGTPVDS